MKIFPALRTDSLETKTSVALSTPNTQTLISKSHLPLKGTRDSNVYRPRQENGTKWVQDMLLCQKVGSSQKLMETWQRTWKHTGVPICQNLDHRASKELTKNAILRNTHGSILKLKKKKKNLKRGAKALHYSRMSMMYKEK